MIKYQNFVTLAILTLITCSACKSSSHHGSTLAKSASVERTAGTVAPSAYYEDTIDLNGRTLTITRTGGASVITGTWSVTLTPTEVERLNVALAAISQAADADAILVGPGGPFPAGGGHRQIVVNATDTFRSGVIAVDGLHEFSVDVQTLYDVVIDVLTDHGMDVTYVVSV